MVLSGTPLLPRASGGESARPRRGGVLESRCRVRLLASSSDWSAFPARMLNLAALSRYRSTNARQFRVLPESFPISRLQVGWRSARTGPWRVRQRQ